MGAATEIELKEKKARVEDALSATRAAVEEGVVPGGGVALIRAQRAVEEYAESLEGDERVGAVLLAEALEEPAWTIAENAGQEGSVIVARIKRREDEREGWDAATDRWGDMFELGIVDPVKVVRSALENAASVSSMVLTTESLVADAPQMAAAAGPLPEAVLIMLDRLRTGPIKYIAFPIVLLGLLFVVIRRVLGGRDAGDAEEA